MSSAPMAPHPRHPATVAPARASSPLSGSAATAGWSREPPPGWPAAAGSTAAMKARPSTSSPSSASRLRSSTTGASLAERGLPGPSIVEIVQLVDDAAQLGASLPGHATDHGFQEVAGLEGTATALPDAAVGLIVLSPKSSVRTAYEPAPDKRCCVRGAWPQVVTVELDPDDLSCCHRGQARENGPRDWGLTPKSLLGA